MLLKKATVKENALKTLKNAQKQIFEQKSSCNIFKSMLDMNVRFFGGLVERHPMGSLWNDCQIPNPLNDKKPTPLVNRQLEVLIFYF